MMSITQHRFKSGSGLSYLKCGSGPAIVLIHGVGLCAEAWLHQTKALSATQSVYAVDMPGHGESDLLPNEKADLSDYVDAIAGWIEQDIQAPVIMMGHSMGATITVQFAIRYPQLCRGAVALNMAYRRSDEARIAVQQRAQNMLNNPDLDKVSNPISRWFDEAAEGLEKEMSELCAGWLSKAPALGYAKAYDIFSRNDGPLDSDLSRLTMPVTFITGDGDNNSSPEMSQKMAELVPKGTAHVVANSRHMVQLTHPNEVNELLLDFVAQCNQQQTGV